MWLGEWGGEGRGKYVFYDFSEVARCQMGWNTENVSSRGGKEHIVGGYEKQYFRAGWVMGCYLFRGLEEAY